MPLKLKLKPGEEIIVNGCVIKNSDKRAMVSIENYADVIRGKDILQLEDATTPLKEVYFLIQTALIDPAKRDTVVPHIQSRLADLAMKVSTNNCGCIFDAANKISTMNYYQALVSVRKVINSEDGQ